MTYNSSIQPMTEGEKRAHQKYMQDEQLARDIEAARGVKPYESMADEPVGGPVNHPKHYNKHGSGIECIDVVEHMGFNLGNAIKYIWRADLKGDAIEDLKKALWYVDREIKKRSR